MTEAEKAMNQATKVATEVADKTLEMSLTLLALSLVDRNDIEGSTCLVARAYECHTFLIDNDPDYKKESAAGFDNKSLRNYVERTEAAIAHTQRHLSEIKANKHYRG